MIKILLILVCIPDCHGIMAVYFIVNRHLTFDDGGSFGKDEHTVRQCDGFGEIVGDEDGGLVCLPDDLGDIGGDIQACLRVKGTERFIQKKEIRVDGHGADQGCTLTHPARQLGRLFIFKGRKSVVRKKLQDIIAVCLGQRMSKFQAEDHILIDRAPFKKVVALQHISDRDRVIVTAVRETFAPKEKGTLLRGKQPGYDGQQGGFADSAYLETFEGALIIKIKIEDMRYFKSTPLEFDLTGISGRISFELFDRRIAKARFAREVGVSRDLVCHYTRENFPEESMQVAVLKSFAEYFNKDIYYFCNDYHKFMDGRDVRKLLKKLRQKEGATQKMFAVKLGVTADMYKTYEQGKCNLPYRVYLRLRELYGPFEEI